MSLSLQVAKVIVGTEAEGPGKRAAIWLQGCPLRCPGCCNPEMLKTTGGEARSIASLTNELCQADIEGITILGGEPFAQAEGAALLAQAAQEAGLSVMVFSGFTLAALRDRKDPATDALLGCCDILVDGMYLADEPESERRWIGSKNQVMHFLTPRYSEEQPCFRSANSVEIRWRPEARQLTVSGWPSSSDAIDPRRADKHEAKR
jgi:anaerobic ribonucleoside-triphosphate reductase activating protein